MWGNISVPTGYSARVPVHSPDSDERVYAEVRYLVGLAELGKLGLINFVTSLELHSEAIRQPVGRFYGYRSDDLNIFDGIAIPSIDGYRLDLKDAKEAQKRRIKGHKDDPFATLSRFLPEKSNFDAWHLHTAHSHRLFCFLTLDFRFVNNIRNLEKGKKLPKLNTDLMLPSELGAKVGLRPIDTFFISYRNSKWAVRPELSLPKGRRQTAPKNDRALSNEEDDVNKKIPITYLPAVGEILGAEITPTVDAVSIQYKDNIGKIHELKMKLGDALYLLSILKAVQLNLDIPFPDDPRNPDAPLIRPSEQIR